MQNPAAALPLRRPLVVTGFGIQGWRPFAIAAAAAVVVSALFTGWTAFHWVSDQATIDVDDIGEAVAAFVAAISCGYAAKRNTGRTRVAWTLFAVSAFSWGVGEVVWSVYQIGYGIAVPPSPAWSDLGFLLAVPLAVGGVFAFTSAPTRLVTRGQTVLSGTIVALSLLFIAWNFGLGKVYATSQATPAAQAVGLAYPVGDIVIATVLVVAMQRARRAEMARLALLLAGVAFNALADSAFAYLNANGTYGPLGSVLDTGWVVGYLMIALAPLWPAHQTHEEVVAEGPISLWQLALPWAAVGAGSLVVLREALAGQQLDQFATVLAGSLGVLFVASHVLSHRDAVELLHKSRHAESQVDRRNKLLNEILTHAPLGIARVGTDMNIIDVNPRMAALLRTTPEKMTGTSVPSYLRPDEFERVYESFQPLWRGAVDSIESDTKALRADGTEVWLHWSATAVRNSLGRISYFLAMYEDTDAEHAANEAAAAHLAGLERLNRLKSEFVSLVSHEFRTALVGISGFSEMIRDEEVTIEEAKAYAADINKDADRLNRMINDMLDLDRIEAGRLTLHIQPVSINDILDDAVQRARASTEKHSIVTHLDPEAPVIQADPDRVAQVIANLLSNAIKYSPDGGEIDVTSVARDGVVDVSVRDHGIGIAPEFIERLFSRYERYEKTSGKILGTGLGLAITRQIVEMHGGKVWVESKPGAGSDFHFTLPVTARVLSPSGA
ncbi:MAG TPA: PAS domain-containing sensor histidine kinase [Candidatus Dormibacteraeota bacterium]|nr:PAS domain-containing sensor histidine kinase [Candidatus Dormibacteraeota bacterium]